MIRGIHYFSTELKTKIDLKFLIFVPRIHQLG